MSTKPVNESDLAWSVQTRGEKYGTRRRQLGAAAGGRELGCSLVELPPGRASWPYHFHLANEEAIYVLEGAATLRLPDGELGLKAGDYVALPAGAASAHQLVNRSGAPCRYLATSTMREPDVTVYPDSGKVGVFAGAAPGGPKEQRTLNAFLPLESAVDYWAGEE